MFKKLFRLSKTQFNVKLKELNNYKKSEKRTSLIKQIAFLTTCC